MPIYEYVCEQCNARFEELVRSVDASKAVCPECGSRQVRRALSVFATRVTESAGGGSPNPGGGCGRCGDPNGPCQF